jgi:hypothetical protein
MPFTSSEWPPLAPDTDGNRNISQAEFQAKKKDR